MLRLSKKNAMSFFENRYATKALSLSFFPFVSIPFKSCLESPRATHPIIVDTDYIRLSVHDSFVLIADRDPKKIRKKNISIKHNPLTGDSYALDDLH